VSQDDETFLSRWSRRKHEARREEAVEPEAATPAAEPETSTTPAALTGSPPDSSLPVAAPEAPVELPPELPPIDSLDGLRSDYQAFLGKTVDEDTRRSALKKLFGDPHFNQMDGLDVYVDDYTQFEPLPAAMRLTLRHAREFLLNSERLALGLDPSPGFEIPPPAAAAPGSADAVPVTAEAAAVAPAELHAVGTPAATAQGADTADSLAPDETAERSPLAGEGLSASAASGADCAPAPRLTPTARDPAAGSAAPPSSTA
jgi:hypothetical protein